MGCIDSTAHTVELYSLLNQITKDAFRNAIAEDDLPAIAELEAETNYPTAIELSETGLLWTSLHFCCRFEAPKCLEYFLRKCYLVQPRQYLQFINHQTSQGSSCLHLCAMWNANKCFSLLVKYGGLNLTLKNKVHKTILGTARDYQRHKMVSALKALMRTHGSITPWNFQLLQTSISYEILSDASYYEKTIADILKKGEKSPKRQEEQKSKQQLELHALKKNIEKEKEEMHQKRLSILREVIDKELAKQQNGEEVSGIDNENNEGPQDKENQHEHISKEEGELEKDFKIKEEELMNIKKAIDLLKQQANFKKLRSEQAKAQAGRSSSQELMNNFITFKSQLIKMQGNKTKLSKEAKPSEKDAVLSAEKEENIEIKIQLKQPKETLKVTHEKQEQSLQESVLPLKSTLREDRSMISFTNNSCLSPADLTHFRELPLRVQKLYVQAQKQGHFMDKQFPHTQQSLGGQDYQVKIKPFIDSMVWLRPDSFLGNHFKLFDGIHPNDVKQGLLSVCYCLATISNLACDPEQISVIFPFYDLSIGFYVLRFYTGGKPNYVVVDDYFPCNASSQQPLFSKPIGQQVWVLLIEKAWAKLMGSYYAAELMTPDQFMEDLTGYPTFGASFKSKKDKLKDIIDCSKKNYPIVLTTGEKKMENMVSNHSYSLLKIYEDGSNRIYKLRNPWGRFEWNGCYGEQSENWTPQLKIKCEFVEGDDGVFFLSEAEMLQAFEYYSIGFNEKNFVYCFSQFSSSKQENVYFKFTHKGGKASIRVSQPFKRMIADPNYRYSGLVFEVGKIAGNQVLFISEGNERCFRGDKSVYACNQILAEYEPGDYFIRLKVDWVDPVHFNSGVLSIFSPHKAEIQRLPSEEGQSLWGKMVYNFASSKPLSILNDDISFSMHWMRGQMVCYAELRDLSKVDELKVVWQFKLDQMKNCQLGKEKSGENQISLCIIKKRGSFGIVQRVSLEKSCSSGKVSIKPLK